MSELLKLGTANMLIHWPVIWRGLLYFLAGYLPAFTEPLIEVLKRDQWPSGPRVALGVLVGTGAGVIILRAYIDGSPQRHADALEKRAGTTQFFKPGP